MCIRDRISTLDLAGPPGVGDVDIATSQGNVIARRFTVRGRGEGRQEDSARMCSPADSGPPKIGGSEMGETWPDRD